MLTKIDKLPKNKHAALVGQVKEAGKRHTSLFPDVKLTSSEKKEGIEDLRAELSRFVEE